MSKKLTTKEWIVKAKKVHGDRYDYSKVEYITAKVKVEIVCEKHGSFWQTPCNHLSGFNCFECRGTRVKNNTYFTRVAKKVHGNRYEYSLVKYTKAKEKVTITCKKHGEFEQTPDNHLQGKGCPECKNKFKPENIIIPPANENAEDFDW